MHEAWLKSALIGVTEAALPTPNGPIGELMTRVQSSEDPAVAFARLAGVSAVCRLAGAAMTLPATMSVAPAPVDAKCLPASHPIAALALEVFDGAAIASPFELRLKVEFCTRLLRTGNVLPHSVLVSALTAGARQAALRSSLLPVLGARGRWLAALNPDWGYASSQANCAAEDEQTLWDKGSQTDRLTWFVATRRRHPELARQRLQEALPEMAVKERLPLVEALAAELTPGDQSLLELLLKDRSREVRDQAAGMLALLPESAHARTLEGWLAPCLQEKRGWLSTSWNLDAPNAADPAWATAAIEAKRPQHEVLGERAWWLYQLVRQVRLSWWTEHTGMSPDALLQWAAKTDWTLALQRGWRERVRPGDTTWIEALLQHGHKSLQHLDGNLLALLPAARREAFWAKDLNGLLAKQQISGLVAALSPGDTLSVDYSRQLLPSLLDAFSDERLRMDYSIRPWLLELTALMHLDVMHQIPALTRRSDETPAMLECVNQFERIVRIRSRVTELSPSPR